MSTMLPVQQIVREFHKRVEAALGVPVEVILYGSHARNKATEGSDVDVLVILPRLDLKVDATVGDIAWEVGFEAGLVLSVVPVSQQELKLLQASPFFQAIQREGIPL